MHKQSDLEFNETELCVWHQDYLRSPPLMVRRHVLVFKDLLTYILKVKFTLRSAIREFDISLKMYEFCRKPFRPGFLCEAVLLLAPLLQRATAGLGITGRSDTIILQSNWHNQRLHKSYRHSQAPGRPLRWQFHGSPPECYLPISREWQIPESRSSTLSHRSLVLWGIIFQNENCNDLQITCSKLQLHRWITTVWDRNNKQMSFSWRSICCIMTSSTVGSSFSTIVIKCIQSLFYIVDFPFSCGIRFPPCSRGINSKRCHVTDRDSSSFISDSLSSAESPTAAAELDYNPWKTLCDKQVFETLTINSSY